MDAIVSDPVVGRLLDGRYAVAERLAVGGMATVYVAHDNRLDREVALKVMHPGYTHDREYVARFHREAMAAARLNSPHVVSILDQGTDDGYGGRVVYLVMELIRGRTLRKLLGERGPLPVELALTIIDPVIAALAAAHLAGIIHRDIKPENILLGDDGRVKVADFGLARPMANGSPSLTQGVLMGTVGYLAPEQLSTGRADTRSDVYAAGIVLFEMLTGETPHAGDTPIAVAYQHVNADVPAPSSVHPGISPAMDAFVLAATARDPDRRPGDGTVMLDELHRLRDSGALGDTGLLDQPGTAMAVPGGGSRGGDTALIRPTSEFDRSGLESYRRAHYGSDDEPPPGSYRRGDGAGGRRWLPALIGVGLVILLVAGILAWRGGGSGKVQVPSVVGENRAAATQALTQVHLSSSFGTPVYSATIAAGNVVTQRPAATAMAAPGSTVVMVLSRGQAPVIIPDVKNRTEDDARTILTQYRLVVGAVRQQSDNTIAAGHAIGTDPAAGGSVAAGKQVTLILSSGASQVTIPTDIIGEDYDQAAQELTSRGLVPARQDVASNDVDQGQVARSAPDPGQQANVGETVTLFVANGDFNIFGGDGNVTIPNDLKGKSMVDAQRELRDLGLKVRIFGSKRGTVNGVIPSEGSAASKGDTVTLF
ncbi:MAG: Stk1 family PASTA domain-containing Ser/Thr kinase [Frankia sp.]